MTAPTTLLATPNLRDFSYQALDDLRFAIYERIVSINSLNIETWTTKMKDKYIAELENLKVWQVQIMAAQEIVKESELEMKG